MKRKSFLAFFLAATLVFTALGSGLIFSTKAAVAEQATVPAPDVSKEPLYPELGEAAGTATADCTDEPDSAGLIPCGRYINDPATAWNECDKCDFCSIALSLQLIMDFTLKVVGVAALLAIVFGQLIAMTAVGQTDMMIKIKSALWQGLLGFAYVLAAWVVVNSLLIFVGYTDPLEGQWYTMC